jgi:hypothetical protein
VKLRVSAAVLYQPFDIPQRFVDVMLDVRIAVCGVFRVQMQLDS